MVSKAGNKVGSKQQLDVNEGGTVVLLFLASCWPQAPCGGQSLCHISFIPVRSCHLLVVVASFHLSIVGALLLFQPVGHCSALKLQVWLQKKGTRR